MTLTIGKYREGFDFQFKISGILDYSTIQSHEEPILIPEGVTRVLVDFSQMEFIDSTGLGMIIEIIRAANEKDLEVQFQGLHETAKELFETVGLFKILETLRKGE